MRNKIHILHYGLSSSKHVGGIETYLLKILSHIDLSLFQIDFLVMKGSEPCYYEKFLSLGCKFHFVTSRKENYLKNKHEIQKLYQEERFDIIHCHFNSLSYIAPCTIACRMNLPVIVHSRNAALIANPLSRFLHFIHFYRLRNLPVIRAAVSDLAGEWMFGRKKFLLLNNGIDTERYLFSEEDRRSVRNELNISLETEVFVNVGKFRKQKNHSFLIKVFAEYLKKHPTAILLLVGNGELKEKIREYVSELGVEKNVVFLGLRNDIPRILSAADKLIFPSLYEGFPNALLEAEGSGLQCIVSDTITKQAVIPELCEALSLNASLDEWVLAMEKQNTENRLNAVDYVKKAGLDINSEVERLSNLYKNVLAKVLI